MSLTARTKNVTSLRSRQFETSEGIVALFDASDDTVDMIQTILKRKAHDSD